MSKDLVTIKKIDFKELKKILELGPPGLPELVPVDSEISIIDATASIKMMREERATWEKRVEPFKNTFFALHRQITGKAGEISGVYDLSIQNQKTEIQEYKRKKHEKQQELIKEAADRAEAKRKKDQADEDRRAKEEKKELEELAVKKEEDGDTDIALDILDASETIKPEKVEKDNTIPFYKKDIVKKKYKYSILPEREQDFLKWAYENGADYLVLMALNKPQFNSWVQRGNNGNNEFISRKEVFK